MRKIFRINCSYLKSLFSVSVIILTAVVILINSIFAAKVEERQIYSKAMNKDIPAIFIIPDSYYENTKAFPVVYLLHGFDGDYRNWVDLTSVEELPDFYDIIIVCPDGSRDSWYFDSPIDPNSQYETHIAIEVVNFTDNNYRTVKSRNGRAIAGLSMGGHGAFFLAWRHNDVFGAVGSMSGGVDLRGSKNKYNISQKIGPFDEYPGRWDSLTVINNASNIQKATLAIIMDCGVDDPFFEMNRAFHDSLLKAEVPNDYIERPGTHNWTYWNNAVKYQVLFFYDFFNKAQSEQTKYGDQN
jgi:S-formylglutathione hydrolase FrmB